MFNFKFDYDCINLFLLWVMYYAGRNISRARSYWKYASLCAIVFIIVEGVRYARGVDYMHYVDIYNYDLEENQRLFTWINQRLKDIGIEAVNSFMFYAVPFILCGLRLMKEMKRYAFYMFPIFLICFISFHEAFIRQALATSFVFLYIVVLNRIQTNVSCHKFKWMDFTYLLICIIVAYSIHSVTIIGLFVITIIFVFVRNPFPWSITIPLLLIGKLYMANHFDWSILNSLLNFMASQDEKLAGYAGNTDRWFSDEAMNDAYTRNISIQILETIADAVLLYLGAKVCKYVSREGVMIQSKSNDYSPSKSHLYISLYNVCVIGVFVFQTFYNLEIVRRVSYSWYLFWFVPLAMILYYRKDKEIFNKKDQYMMYAFVFWIWDYIRFLFVFKNEPLFIWDI